MESTSPSDNLYIKGNTIGWESVQEGLDQFYFVENDSSLWFAFFAFAGDIDETCNLIIQDNTFNAFSEQSEDSESGLILRETEHHTIISGTINSLVMNGNIFNSSLEFFDADVQHELWMNGNQFNGLVSIAGLLFSEKKNSIEWSQCEDYRLASIRREVSEVSTTWGTNYNFDLNRGGSPGDIEDSIGYYSILTSYNSLFQIYKRNNEMTLANACYAEMKKVETRYWKNLYQKEGRFENYFRWRLNDFLSYFTDYGTNPAKAVIKSIWVILIFSIFYLFFPSDWDISNRSTLLKKTRELVSSNREKSFMATLGFVTYSGFIHLLNAINLSLNAFTTLGFGDIPTHGAARYVTIVQGFIGWFLLTIFSVSLINQVLG